MSRLGNLAKVGLGGALGVAATNSDAAGQTFEALFKAPSLATLMGLAGIATQRQIAAPAPGGFDPVVMAALQSATDALRAVTLTQQRSGSNSLSRAVVWLAVPAGIALAIHHFGWARVGWVTGETMQRSLQAVRNYVGTRISELSEALAARFDRLEGSLQETHESIQRVSITTAEVMAEVHSVAASLASLEERLTPLESNAATAANGIGVLCELVKTSGLLSNASAESLRRLDDFTGAKRTEPTTRMLPAPAAQLLPSPLSVPAPQLHAMPSFMSAIMTPSPMNG